MTQQNPRDPGRIAGAFSRARNQMAQIRTFDEQVRDMAAEAGGRRTSGRSPARPSAATRSELTGVTENLTTQGWTNPATSLPHLCFPPDTYPQACGPGSEWRCRCDAVWVSSGIMWAEYPQTPTRSEAALGPERWRYVGGGQLLATEYHAQEGLYDWRPLGPYYVKLYRAMIDNQLAAEDVVGVEFTDWRDLG